MKGWTHVKTKVNWFVSSLRLSIIMAIGFSLLFSSFTKSCRSCQSIWLATAFRIMVIAASTICRFSSINWALRTFVICWFKRVWTLFSCSLRTASSFFNAASSWRLDFSSSFWDSIAEKNSSTALSNVTYSLCLRLVNWLYKKGWNSS